MIDAHVAHIHGVAFGPAELAGVEGHVGVEIAAVKFVPADMAQRHGRRRIHAIRAGAFEQHECRAARIAHHRETANARNIFRRALDPAPCRDQPRGIRIDIGRGDIATPPGGHAAIPGLIRDGHHPAQRPGAADDQRIAAILAERHSGPAYDIAVESERRLRVAGHQLDPEKLPVAISHCPSPAQRLRPFRRPIPKSRHR